MTHRPARTWYARSDEAGRKITMHGFRTTLMNWSQVYAIETDKLVEQQLAHVEKDQTLASYMRADLLGRRAVLMQKYADYAMGTFVPEVPR
jgi:integrase